MLRMIRVYLSDGAFEGYHCGFVLGAQGSATTLFVPSYLSVVKVPADKLANATEVTCQPLKLRQSILTRAAAYRRGGNDFARKATIDVLKALGAARETIRAAVETANNSDTERRRQAAEAAAERRVEHEAFEKFQKEQIERRARGELAPRPRHQLTPAQAAQVTVRANGQFTLGI
jgi:hypothetical protein